MQALRHKYPRHVPCRVHLPDKSALKLLLPLDATIATVMVVVRRKWPGTLSEAHALFCFHGNRICIGNTRLAALDVTKPDEIHLTVRLENTFG